MAGVLLTPLLARLNPKLRDYSAVGFALVAAILAATMIPDVLASEEPLHEEVERLRLPLPFGSLKAGVLVDPLSHLDVPGAPEFFTTVAWIGGITAFLAASQAVIAREIKKVLAYSTISQIGYMMLALGAAGFAVDFTSGYVAGRVSLGEPRCS